METTQGVDQLKASLRGELVQPGDAKYADSCKVYNGMIQRKPKYIVYCSDVSDVRAAVNFGRENNLLIAIRGGGHNGPGLALCDDGIVLDLSMMKGIRVDPAAGTARVTLPGDRSRDRRP